MMDSAVRRNVTEGQETLRGIAEVQHGHSWSSLAEAQEATKKMPRGDWEHSGIPGNPGWDAKLEPRKCDG